MAGAAHRGFGAVVGTTGFVVHRYRHLFEESAQQRRGEAFVKAPSGAGAALGVDIPAGVGEVLGVFHLGRRQGQDPITVTVIRAILLSGGLFSEERLSDGSVEIRRDQTANFGAVTIARHAARGIALNYSSGRSGPDQTADPGVVIIARHAARGIGGFDRTTAVITDQPTNRSVLFRVRRHGRRGINVLDAP